MANLILEHEVRVLAGDFSTSLWLVVPMLQERGISMQYVASYAWKHRTKTAVHLDTCGIFVRGARRIDRAFAFADFCPGRGHGQNAASPDSGDAWGPQAAVRPVGS